MENVYKQIFLCVKLIKLKKEGDLLDAIISTFSFRCLLFMESFKLYGIETILHSMTVIKTGKLGEMKILNECSENKVQNKYK